MWVPHMERLCLPHTSYLFAPLQSALLGEVGRCHFFKMTVLLPFTAPAGSPAISPLPPEPATGSARG